MLYSNMCVVQYCSLLTNMLLTNKKSSGTIFNMLFPVKRVVIWRATSFIQYEIYSLAGSNHKTCVCAYSYFAGAFHVILCRCFQYRVYSHISPQFKLRLTIHLYITASPSTWIGPLVSLIDPFLHVNYLHLICFHEMKF